eukprot:scaffold699_cov385-Prasinococcus_capsulatus_cf.AAC.9
MRLRRLVRVVNSLESNFKYNYVRITFFKLFSILILTGHISGCFLYYIARCVPEAYLLRLVRAAVIRLAAAREVASVVMARTHCRQYDFDQDTWVGMFEPRLPSSPVIDQYITSVYWAFTTITTVGYGDISPVNIYERLYTLLTMFVNLVISAFILGNMTLLATKRNAEISVHRWGWTRSIPLRTRTGRSLAVACTDWESDFALQE